MARLLLTDDQVLDLIEIEGRRISDEACAGTELCSRKRLEACVERLRELVAAMPDDHA